MAHRFPKSARLLRAEEFAAVREQGRATRSGCLRVAVLAGDAQRLGLAVSRRAGKAHDRNRFKRVVREFFRLHRDRFPQGDCVVIPFAGAAELPNSVIRHDLESALTRWASRPKRKPPEKA